MKCFFLLLWVPELSHMEHGTLSMAAHRWVLPCGPTAPRLGAAFCSRWAEPSQGQLWVGTSICQCWE